MSIQTYHGFLQVIDPFIFSSDDSSTRRCIAASMEQSPIEVNCLSASQHVSFVETKCSLLCARYRVTWYIP
jgi:hypothetical protein